MRELLKQYKHDPYNIVEEMILLQACDSSFLEEQNIKTTKDVNIFKQKVKDTYGDLNIFIKSFKL